MFNPTVGGKRISHGKTMVVVGKHFIFLLIAV